MLIICYLVSICGGFVLFTVGYRFDLRCLHYRGTIEFGQFGKLFHSVVCSFQLYICRFLIDSDHVRNIFCGS